MTLGPKPAVTTSLSRKANLNRHKRRSADPIFTQNNNTKPGTPLQHSTDGYTGNNTDQSKSKPKGKPSGNGGGRGGRGNRVNRLVDAQIRAGVDDLRKERRMVRREAATERRAAKRDYRQGLGDLDYIYGETADYTNAMGQQIQANYGAAKDRASQAQAALVAALGGNSAAAQTNVTDNLSQLGISGINMDQFSADAANALSNASISGANNMAAIDAAASGAADISALIQGMVAGSKSAAYGEQLNDLNDRLFENSQMKRDGLMQVREAISDLRGTRKDLTLQMLQQLGGSQWGRYLRNRGRGGSRGGSYSSSGYSGSYSGGGSSSSSSGGSGFTSENGGKANLNQLLLNGLAHRKR